MFPSGCACVARCQRCQWIDFVDFFLCNSRLGKGNLSLQSQFLSNFKFLNCFLSNSIYIWKVYLIIERKLSLSANHYKQHYFYQMSLSSQIFQDRWQLQLVVAQSKRQPSSPCSHASHIGGTIARNGIATPKSTRCVTAFCQELIKNKNVVTKSRTKIKIVTYLNLH